MKNILIVIDEPNWIFHRHALEIQKRLSGDYKIDIAHHRQNIPELSKDYGLVYVLDPMPMRYPPQEKTIMGLRCEFIYREHPEGAKGLYEKGFPGRCVSIKDKCCMMHVVNKNQMNVFKDIVTDKPLLLVQHGIDESVFDKNKYQKIKNNILTVSMSGRNSKNKAFEVVLDACKKLNINFLAAQYGQRQIKKEDMPYFYSKVDVHVCMSKNEGLNNTIMEAGAMGLGVISTDCGAIREIVKNEESGLIIERNQNSLIEALEKIKDDKYREKVGNNLYNEIMNNWTWKVRINDFKNMFDLFFEGK